MCVSSLESSLVVLIQYNKYFQIFYELLNWFLGNNSNTQLIPCLYACP